MIKAPLNVRHRVPVVLHTALPGVDAVEITSGVPWKRVFDEPSGTAPLVGTDFQNFLWARQESLEQRAPYVGERRKPVHAEFIAIDLHCPTYVAVTHPS